MNKGANVARSFDAAKRHRRRGPATQQLQERESDQRCGGQSPCLPAERLPAPERTATGQFYRRRTGCAWRAWVRFASLALARRLPPFKHPWLGAIFPLGFSVDFGRIRASPCALSHRCDRGLFLSRPVCCNRLYSEDRAMQPNPLILLRRTIQDLLQLPDDVTRCFSNVTTSIIVRLVADMPKRSISDGSDTPQCENVWRTARKPAFNRLQK